MLELQAIGDESEHCSGFYLEFLEFNEGVGEYELSLERSDMRYKPTCLGYLRTDVSRVAQLWDQSQIRKLATRLGYDFADMVIYDPKFGRPPFARLKAQAIRLDAEAVIVPSPEHTENVRHQERSSAMDPHRNELRDWGRSPGYAALTVGLPGRAVLVSNAGYD